MLSCSSWNFLTRSCMNGPSPPVKPFQYDSVTSGPSYSPVKSALSACCGPAPWPPPQAVRARSAAATAAVQVVRLICSLLVVEYGWVGGCQDTGTGVSRRTLQDTGGVVGLVVARADAPAHVLDERAEQPGVGLREDEAGIEHDGRLLHVQRPSDV